MTITQQLHNVGGVLLKQPFKIRRLGHFGLNVTKMEEMVHFYRDLLGFKETDFLDFGKRPGLEEKLKDVPDARGRFFHYGTDHHAFVLFPQPAMAVLDRSNERSDDGDVTINQITWQIGSLAEMVNGYRFFREREVPIQRVGRDMPGSNWHTYVYDPDGHVNELYYGIEQVGWDGRAKPQEMYYRGFREEPSLPQMSEEAEVEEASQRGIDVTSGNRGVEKTPARYDVGGVLLSRPFKITKIGPVNLFVRDVSAALEFYIHELGFVVTEEVDYTGHRVVFLRNGAEHHSVGLFPKTLRQELGCSPHISGMSFGVEVGSYQQLQDAVAFLKENGVLFREIPNDLHPGIDYTAYAIDPEGHLLQLYYYMEQIGWDGRPRPRELRRQVSAGWPETLDALSDTYVDQVFQGPLG